MYTDLLAYSYTIYLDNRCIARVSILTPLSCLFPICSFFFLINLLVFRLYSNNSRTHLRTRANNVIITCNINIISFLGTRFSPYLRVRFAYTYVPPMMTAEPGVPLFSVRVHCTFHLRNTSAKYGSSFYNCLRKRASFFFQIKRSLFFYSIYRACVSVCLRLLLIREIPRVRVLQLLLVRCA